MRKPHVISIGHILEFDNVILLVVGQVSVRLYGRETVFDGSFKMKKSSNIDPDLEILDPQI